MKRGGIFVLCLGVLGGAAVAAAADWGAPEAYAGDGTAWLAWDNGTVSETNVILPQWIGHDFDLSTLEHFTYVRRFRMFMRAWPNRRWDGGRIGIYGFSGGVPGSLLWGPEFVTPTREGWNDFDVGHYLGGRKRFLPAWEVFYNYPNGDTLCFDTGPARGHTWAYYGGQWTSYEGPNANLMLRVEVDDEHNPAVAPASLGRLKALYR